MKFDKQMKISMPSSLKNKVTDMAVQLGMNTAYFVRFILYEAIKENRVMTSIPTMKCDAHLKFKAPVEFMMHIEQQANESNIAIGTFIRVLLCSGQQNLATLLEFFQNCRSAIFGVNPSLCR